VKIRLNRGRGFLHTQVLPVKEIYLILKIILMSCRTVLSFFIGLILTLSCCNSPKLVSKEDILVADLDSAINPADDFFEYTNGGWFKKNPIPPDRSFWGTTAMDYEDNLTRLKGLNERAASENAAHGTTDQKIGDFWITAMDSDKIETSGLKPLQFYLDKINEIKDVNSVVTVIAELEKIGSNKLFSCNVYQDEKNKNSMKYTFGQGGLGLPEREYYLKNDSTTVNIRNSYMTYITKLLMLSGEDSGFAKTAGENILELETNLAQASQKSEDTNSIWNYNKVAIHDLKNICSTIDWSTYLENVGVKNCDSVIVYQIPFFKALKNILKSTPINDWKEFLKFHLLDNFSDALPDEYGIETFHFNQLLGGAKERSARWKRVIDMENDVLGELLGKLYVKEYFSDNVKQRYSDLVESLKTAMKERISRVTWMSDSAKQNAYIKLAAMSKKVGYPDKWKDFSALNIGKESYVQNLLNSRLWWHNYQINKLDKPVNSAEWNMPPQINNGYYDGAKNEIVLPAAFFIFHGLSDNEIDDAMLYGYAGIKIGHEIGHAFGDGGRLYDEKGNMMNGWTKKDDQEFNARADKLIKQYSEYEPVKGYHINGVNTVGENMANLCGELIAIDAFKKTNEFKAGENINGKTPLQRFFLANAFKWRIFPRQELLISSLFTDGHSPPKYGMNGTLVNIDDFYIAFNVKPGNKMYKTDSLRIRIW
jgi:putative endopeptidase